MKALQLDVHTAAGRVLCCTIFKTGGRKFLAKGHTLSDEDVHLLETAGLEQVWVTELEEGEVGEDEAVMAVADAICSGSVEIQIASGGRANLVSTADCCVLIEDELLKQINCTGSIVIATVQNYQFVRAGERIATIKSAPFAIHRSQLEAVLSILNEQGTIVQARPIREATLGILYTDPLHGDRARAQFENIARARADRFNARVRYALSAVEDEEHVTCSLQHLLQARPVAILIASTTAPAGPEDVVGRSMTKLDVLIEHFLAPVEPGNLMLLGYKNEVPVVSAPGCFRSTKPNILDLILPPMLANYRLSGREIASLGHGGLLD